MASVPFLSRVHEVLITKDPWPKIKAEEQSIRRLYLDYLCLLALIPATVHSLRVVVFGKIDPVAQTVVDVSVLQGAAWFILIYLWELLDFWVMAHLQRWISARLGGSSAKIDAFKLAAYAFTANAVVRCFCASPDKVKTILLSISLLLFNIHIIWRAAGPLMQLHDRRSRIIFIALSQAAIFIARILVGLVLGLLQFAALRLIP